MSAAINAWRDIDDALTFQPLIDAAGRSPPLQSEIREALRAYGDAGFERYQHFCARVGVEADKAYWDGNRGTTNVRRILELAKLRGWGPSTFAPNPATTAAHATEPVTVTPRTAVTKSIAIEGELLSAVDRTLQSDRGKFLSNTSNADVALAECSGTISLAYDEFKRVVLIQLPGNAKLRELKDDDITAVQIHLQRHAGLLHISKTATEDAIHFRAHKNSVDSVADWLTSLKWDQKRRLSLLMPRGFGTETDRYHIRAGRNLCLALVARALKPGCKVDEAVILEGPQGSLKSSALRALVGAENFKELTADPHSKDFEQQLLGVWLGEFAELNVLRRPEDIARIKGFITNDIDHFRIPHAKTFTDFPRRTVLCGSTNAESWMHDPTGGRRFIPVQVGKIDLSWLRDNREQLFAEAVALYKADRRWWIYPKDHTLAEQQARAPQDPWSGEIREYLYGRVELTDLSPLLRHLGISTERQTQAQLTRVGVILRQLGCVKKQRRRADGNGEREYCRLVPAEYASQPRRDAPPVDFPSPRSATAKEDFSDLL